MCVCSADSSDALCEEQSGGTMMMQQDVATARRQQIVMHLVHDVAEHVPVSHTEQRALLD